MGKLETILAHQFKERAEAVRRLEGFMLNPGRFAVLVLGMRGTGKTHWLNVIQQCHSRKEFLNDIIMINAGLYKNRSQDFWEEKFAQAQGKILVIDDVDRLSSFDQEILFEGLSTGPGACYGFDKKKYKFRIVFTSTFDIKTLRDTEKYLSHKFFDRISQLVVKLPAFTDAVRFQWNDFKSTWEKMAFETKNHLPGPELKSWLENHCHELIGNFRDLDKIAINWHNYRLTGISEHEILTFVVRDFKELYHFPEHKSELSAEFRIDESLNWEENLAKFRKNYKEWVKISFGSLRKGEKKAGISFRTMERW